MPKSDRTAFFWTGALLSAVASLAFVVGWNLPGPPTKTEIQLTVEQHLETVARARTDRAASMHALNLYLAENQPAARSAVTSPQIDHIASLIVDRDRDVARLALNLFLSLGPSAKPAAARVVAYLRSEPSLRFDRFAWNVEFALRDNAPSIQEMLGLVPEMKRGAPEQQSELVRRVAMLTDYLVMHGGRANPKVFVDPAINAIADILSQKEAPSVLTSAARALGSLGPMAEGAIPALEVALAEAKKREAKFAVCAGFCPSLVDEYQRALKCIRMDRSEFEIAYRFGHHSCGFPSNPD